MSYEVEIFKNHCRLADLFNTQVLLIILIFLSMVEK